MTTTEALRDFAAGSVGGFAGKILEYPLDTLKVLLQTTQVGTSSATTGDTVGGITKPATTTNRPRPIPQYSGVWDCFQYNVQNYGFTSLYKGISSPLLGSVAENAVLFWAYNHCQRMILDHSSDHDSNSNNRIRQQRQLNLWELSLAGAGAGFVVSFVLTPVELVKCRLQVSNSFSSRYYTGPWDVIKYTIRNEGIFHGLFRGHFGVMCREIPGNFCYFGVYEYTCRSFVPPGGSKERNLRPYHHMISGALSGTAYWLAFYPADTVKALQQSHPEYARFSFLETFVRVYQLYGIRGLYRGLGLTLLKSAPKEALVFAGYEWTVKMLR